MDNEEQVPSTVVAESPSSKTETGGLNVEDIQSQPFDQVRKKLRMSRAEKRAAKGFVGSQQESDEAANPSGDDEYAAENTQTSSETTNRTQEQPKAKAPEPTANERLQAAENEAREAQRKLQEYEAKQRKDAEEAEVKRRQQEYLQTVQAIQNQPDWSPAYKEQVLQAYQQQLLMGELNAYGQHVQAQEKSLAQREQEANLREMRGKLPEYVSSIVDFVGKQVDVPTDNLRTLTSSQPFQQLLADYQHPRDLAIMGEMLHVFAQHERQTLAAQAEQNRLDALGEYETNNIPTRVNSTGGAGGGKSTVQRINEVPSEKWSTYVKLLKSEGTPARALAKLKEAK